jgi:hypothetical protein
MVHCRFFQNWFDVNVLDFQLPFNVDYFDIFWFGHCFGDLFKNGAKVFLQSFGHTDFFTFLKAQTLSTYTNLW